MFIVHEDKLKFFNLGAVVSLRKAFLKYNTMTVINGKYAYRLLLLWPPSRDAGW